MMASRRSRATREYKADHERLLAKLAKTRRQARRQTRRLSRRMRKLASQVTSLTARINSTPLAAGGTTAPSEPTTSAMIDHHHASSLIPIETSTFHHFNKLPAELRLRIWQMSLPGTRIFEPRAQCINDNGIVEFEAGLANRYPPPAIRGVCKEAWNVTEKHGHFSFGFSFLQRGGSWFNPDLDIVYFSCGKHRPEDICAEEDFEWYTDQLSQCGIKHIAYRLCVGYGPKVEPIWSIKTNLPDLTSITLTCERNRNALRSGLPCTMVPLQPEDNSLEPWIHSSGNDNSEMCWELHMYGILESWESRERELADGWLPELHGAEVIRMDKPKSLGRFDSE